MSYPGEMARKRCAERTREELRQYKPTRPLAPRDEIRLKVMLARCATCRACPLVVRTLTIMAPTEPEKPSAEVIRLAG